MIVLVGGGSRSGKSRFALERARECGAPLAFIATAEAHDDEMRARAATHQRERGHDFFTTEEPLEVARSVSELGNSHRAVVVDCLTLWICNVMSAGRDVSKETDRLLVTATGVAAPVILVSNEVGCGIVPENELARRFRDAAGIVNQKAASAAAEVYWMAFGIPMRVK